MCFLLLFKWILFWNLIRIQKQWQFSFHPQGGNKDQYSAVDDPQDCRLLRAEGTPRNHPASPPSLYFIDEENWNLEWWNNLLVVTELASQSWVLSIFQLTILWFSYIDTNSKHIYFFLILNLFLSFQVRIT